MESIGTLAGGIAHDLNNVLAPIMMSIDLLRIDDSDGRNREILETIAASARRGAEMVAQVLSFARGVDGQRVEVRLPGLIEDLVKIVGETFPKNIGIKTAVASGLWSLEADPTQIHQVLLNLFVNARDAMPEGGTITVAAENTVIDEHYASMILAAREGRHVRIEVEDTGGGMPRETSERIFDPFFTTKETGKGTGLGLSTTLAIINSHGGFIQVYSEVGVGTKFRIFLPARTPTAPESPTTEEPLPHGRGETILVIDDEASIRQVTARTLESFGYRVLVAEDGAQALTRYIPRKAEIDLVLTDMMMPVMDGPTTIRALRNIDPKVRIIGTSGISANGKAVQEAGVGVTRFLPKPYTTETLLGTVRLVLDERDERD